MLIINLVIGIWILQVIFSTYNLYINPNLLEEKKRKLEEAQKFAGERTTNTLLIIIYLMFLLFDFLVFGAIHYFYGTKIIDVAITICLFFGIINSFFVFNCKPFVEWLEILKKCTYCFVAVMTTIYIIL